MKRGRFIVIEGLDGSGKSTQASRLLDHLKEPSQKLVFKYAGVHLTSEPTPNLIGGLIRSQLKGDWRSSNECLQLLFAADRAYHLEKEILPLLEHGVTVISDRYFFSSFAYGALDVPMEWLYEINKNFPTPDLTFVIDVAPKTCIKRITANRELGITLFEKEKELELVRANYRKLTRRFKNVFLVDGNRPIGEVAEDIASIVDRKFG